MGKSAVRVIEGIDQSRATRYLGCPVEAARSGPDEDGVLSLLRLASDRAIADGGLAHVDFDRDRAAVVIGLSKGALRHLAHIADRALFGHGNSTEPDTPWTWAWPHFGSSFVADRHGLRGPCLAPVAACATGLVGALQGAALIRRGECDLAFVGAADASIEPHVLAALRNMRATVPGDGIPYSAVRPFDRARRGFVVGEGGAILVLEHEAHARARGARAYTEFAAGALGSEAHHLTDQDPDPRGLAHLIQLALRRASVDAAEIEYVNAHGTATRTNDPLECLAVRMALGSHADGVSCSSNKSQIGHLLGASGAAELAIACLAIHEQFVPPTLNLDNPDPECDLDCTPHVGKSRTIRTALKISLGFGGHMAVAVLRRP